MAGTQITWSPWSGNAHRHQTGQKVLLQALSLYEEILLSRNNNRVADNEC